MSNTGRTRQTADKIGELATAVIGNAAGTVVEPKKGATMLAGRLKSPAALGVGIGLGLAYLLGRRRSGSHG